MGLGKSLSMIALMVKYNHDQLPWVALSGTSEVAATLLIVPPSREYIFYGISERTLTPTSPSDMRGAVSKVKFLRFLLTNTLIVQASETLASV
jgi:hypothetical protein